MRSLMPILLLLPPDHPSTADFEFRTVICIPPGNPGMNDGVGGGIPGNQDLSEHRILI